MSGDRFDEIARDFDRKWRGPNLDYDAMLADFALTIRAAVEAARERCAKIAKEQHDKAEANASAAYAIESAIRARGGK